MIVTVILVEEAVKKASEKSMSKRYRYDTDDNPSQYSSREFNEFDDYEKLWMITPRYISDWNLNDDEDISNEIDISQNNFIHKNNTEGKEESNPLKYDDYIQKLSTIKETESLETKQLEDTVNFGLLNKDSQNYWNYLDKDQKWSKKIILTSFLTEESEWDIMCKKSDSKRESRLASDYQDSNLMVNFYINLYLMH